MSFNGRLSADQLTLVGDSIYLSNRAAKAWSLMVTACAKDTGHTMTITPPDGGYRDLAMQQYLIDHPEGPVPIAPLGYSTHGMGDAVDIHRVWLVYGWLRGNAHRFGFHQQFASEAWHWKHDGSEPAGNDVTPIDEQIEEEETMTTYMEPTENSPAINGISRIWAGGPRELPAGSLNFYSGVWELTSPGARRLTVAEWNAIQRAYAAAGRKVPLASVSGIEAETIVFAPPL